MTMPSHINIDALIRRSGYSVALAEQDVRAATGWASAQQQRVDVNLESRIHFGDHWSVRHLTVEEQGVLVRALRRSVQIIHKAKRA